MSLHSRIVIPIPGLGFESLGQPLRSKLQMQRKKIQMVKKIQRMKQLETVKVI